MTRKDLEAEVLNLPADERASLAQKLLLSLDEISDADVGEAWLVEIRRRVADLDSGKVKPVPADEVMRRARALLR